MALWQNIPGKNTKIDKKNLSRMEMFTQTSINQDSDYFVNFDGANGLDNYDTVKIAFTEAVDNQKQARLSLDNGNTFYDIETLKGEEVENQEIELIFKMGEWILRTVDIKKELAKLLNKHLISVGLNTVYTIQTQNTAETMSGFVERDKVGTKLSSNTYGIVIGAGVKKVRVDYCTTSQSTAINLRGFTYLLHNVSPMTQESHYYSGTGQQVTTGRSGVLLEVEEGDTIGVRVYGGKNNIFMAGSSLNKYWGTTITVEVIE